MNLFKPSSLSCHSQTAGLVELEHEFVIVEGKLFNLLLQRMSLADELVVAHIELEAGLSRGVWRRHGFVSLVIMVLGKTTTD